jgi:hypothetical protein
MRYYLLAFLVWLLLLCSVRAEPMIQYFNTSWAEITQKMPELAEDIRYINLSPFLIRWFQGWDAHNVEFILPLGLKPGIYRLNLTGTNATGRTVVATRTIQYNP